MKKKSFQLAILSVFSFTLLNCSPSTRFESASSAIKASSPLNTVTNTGTNLNQNLPLTTSSNTDITTNGSGISVTNSNSGANTAVTTNGSSVSVTNSNSGANTAVTTNGSGVSVTNSNSGANTAVTTNGSGVSVTNSNSGANTTATTNTNTSSSSCPLDPSVTTTTMLASVNKSFALAMSLCRDGVRQFGFFAGQRVFAKVVVDPNSLPAKICIATHNHLNNCSSTESFVSMVEAGFVEEIPGVYRKEFLLTSAESGYGYVFNVRGRDFTGSQSAGMVFPENMPQQTRVISDVGVSNLALGNQVSSLRPGETAFIQVPAASAATLKVCFEDMSVENSCRKFSDFVDASGDFTASAGSITFRVPIDQALVGRSYVIHIYDTAVNLYHMSGRVIRIVQ